MTGFATFAYSKKYFVSQEIEFIPESEIDPEFGESYKAPQELINLLSDNIIVLENGTVVEQGNHEVLTALKGKYYELVKNQLELGN